MTRTRKRKLKIQLIALSLFLIASLSTLSVSVYAWFATNQSVTGTGLRITADRYDAIENVEFFAAERPDVSVTPTAYYFDKTPIADNDDKIIPIYDRVFSQDAHQLLIKITVNERVDACELFAEADSVVITNNSWDDIDWHGNYSSGVGDPLSSVISFVPYPVDQVFTENRYNKDCYKLTGNATSSSFVSLDNNYNPVYDADATIDIATYDMSDNHTIYLMLDYDKNLVESIYSYYLTDVLFNTGYNITFACDFTISIRVLEEHR